MTDLTVPLLDLEAQNGPLRTALLEALARVLDSQRFILGPEVEALERELEAALGTPHAVGVSSGTDALLVALMALGVGPGDEVVVPAYSFFATAGSVVRLGARPVLVDIDRRTCNIDPAQAVAAITPRTRAIMPVHLFGASADLDPLVEAAAAAGVPIVEDACQAIGARYRGRAVGTIGAFGCFSFFPSKNLGGLGDGGLVVTGDAALAEQARRLRNHGQGDTYHHAVVGGNFRLDALQAAALRVKLPHLPAWTAGRARNARRYRTLFAEAGLEGIVTLPVERDDRDHIYNQFVIEAPRRDALRAYLASRRIATGIYYPVPFHLQECFRALGYRPGAFPQAEGAAQASLALPIYGELTGAQLEHVVGSIAEFYRA
jgi:dTDP-4-amino-4,6-dideoxygalactose transaminase